MDVSLLIYIVVVLIIAGAFAWLVQIAPFIEATIKSFIVWVIIAFAVLIVVLKLAALI